MADAFVIRVRFFDSEEEDFYFGSKKAIFSLLSEDKVGIKASVLNNKKLPLETRFCAITKHLVTRKRQKSKKISI